MKFREYSLENISIYEIAFMYVTDGVETIYNLDTYGTVRRDVQCVQHTA